MKLHVYIVKKPYNEPPYLRYEEVEVEEKPKTYVVKERPKGFYMSRISKDSIGVLIPECDAKVILLEKDDAKAKFIFRNYFEHKIEELEHTIKNYNNLMKNLGL